MLTNIPLQDETSPLDETSSSDEPQEKSSERIYFSLAQKEILQKAFAKLETLVYKWVIINKVYNSNKMVI